MDNTYTLQDTFNKIYTHLLQQGRKSTLESPELCEGEDTYYNACAYRGEGGARCAIGCLIPDEFYSIEMEGQSVHYNLVRDALTQTGYGAVDQVVLGKLQYIHDENHEDEWADALAEFAARYNLSIPTRPEGGTNG